MSAQFIKELDALAEHLGLSCAKLLKQMGVRSRSLVSYWAAGNKPVEQHALQLALVEKRSSGLSDEEAVAAAAKWIKLAGRFDPSRHDTTQQLLALLKDQDADNVGEPYPLWVTKLIRELDEHGMEWGEWVKACWHAQRAAQQAQEEWLNTSSTEREVWHLHFWNSSLSGTALNTNAMEDQYVSLLKQSNTKVFLMVLYDEGSADPTLEVTTEEDGVSPMSEEERKERSQFTSFLNIIQSHKNCRVFSGCYNRNIENTGDVWGFESLRGAFGLLIRVPAQLPRILEPLLEEPENIDARNRFVEFAALPIRIRVEEYRELLRARGIELVPGRDFGLRIVPRGPANPSIKWERRVSPTAT